MQRNFHSGERDAMKNVLLVDDDRYYSAVFQQLLMLDGCNVISCDSGPQALTMLQDRSFHVAIVEYRLPGMNGDEISRLLRARSPATRIVGFSIDDKKENEFLESGADAFYPKNEVRELLMWLKSTIR